MLPMLLTVFTVRSADFPTTMSGLNPAAWWRLNETAASPVPNIASNWSTLGAVGNGYVLPLATNGVAGRVGNAVQLSGDPASCVDVPFNATLNPNPPFSVEFWVKGAAQGDSTGNCPLSSFAGSFFFPNNRSGWLFYLNNNGRMEFRIGGENLYSGLADSANGVVTASAWTHVAGTYNGAVQRLYINGAKVAEVTLTSAEISNFQPNKWSQLCIGRTGFEFGGNRFFTGLVDEVAVYASLLSDSTVKAHFDAATTNAAGYHAQILAANPVGYWPLDEPAYTFPNTNTYPVAVSSGTIASPGADGTNTLGVLAAQPGPGYSGLLAGDKSCLFSGEAGNLRLGNPSVLSNLVGRVTLLAWIKPTVKDTGRTVIEHGSVDANFFETGTFLRIGDPVDFELSSDAPNTAYYEVGATADGTTYNSAKYPVPDGDIGNWVFLAGTFDGANWNLYRNGVLVAQAADTVGAVRVTNSWSVGSISDPGPDFGANFRFGGWINEPAIFTNALSGATIQALYLSANVPPVIYRAPQLPAIVYDGSSLTLDIWAEGNPTLVYNWYKNGSPLGVTTTNLALNNLTTNNSGTYTVAVTNNFGAVTSSVSMTVTQSTPVVTIQPQSLERFRGLPFTLSVTAVGSPPIFYQWYLKKTLISGATSSAYTNTAASSSDGNYTCVLSNQYSPTQGTSTSAVATVTTFPPPTGYGSNILADGPIAYWRLDEFSGTNAFDLVGSHDGQYFNVTQHVHPGYSVIDSDNAISVSGSPNSYVGNINGNPNVSGPVINFEGTNASFTLEAWVNGPAQPGGSAIIAKGTGDNGTTANEQFCLDISDGGNYHFFVRDRFFQIHEVEADLGPSSSWDHVVGVFDAVELNMFIYVNGEQRNTASTGGADIKSSTALVSIGSKRDGTDPDYNDGFTGSLDEVAIYDKALSAAQVQAHYAAAYGTTTPPAISRQPQSLTTYVTLPASFTVGAYGTSPLSYQWKKYGTNITDGGNISGTTSDILTINPLTLSDAGNYSVTVNNSVGPATNSAVVTLNVLPAPSSPPNISQLVLHLQFEGNLNDATGRGNNGTKIGAASFVSDNDGLPFGLTALNLGQCFHYMTDTNEGSGITNYATLDKLGHTGLVTAPGSTTTNTTPGTNVPPDLKFGSGVSFTVAYWIRLSGNFAGDDLPFFASAVGSTFGFGYVFAPTFGFNPPSLGGNWPGGWAASVFDVNGAGIGVYGDVGSINDGGWHHLVHIIDREAGMSTYLDGVLAHFSKRGGTTAADADNIDSGYAPCIGQDPSGGYFEAGEAWIDDLGVWRRALTPLEAQSIFMAASANNPGLSFTGTFTPSSGITLQRLSATQLKLTWSIGVLQQADSVTGPYTDVTVTNGLTVSRVTSPHTNSISGTQKFYRALD